MRSWDGASEPCDMHKYRSCTSYLAHLHHPCMCVSNVSMRHVVDLALLDVHFGSADDYTLAPSNEKGCP